jgi:hypothetical protein
MAPFSQHPIKYPQPNADTRKIAHTGDFLFLPKHGTALERRAFLRKD